MKPNKTKIIINLCLSIIAFIAFAILAIAIKNDYRLFRIVGHSMNPTLYEKNIVLTKPQKEYQRGDIIAFTKDGGTTIKRIIGLPGDTIYIDEDGHVSVNDKLIDEPYVIFHQMLPSEVEFPITLKTDEYFVLGDNRQNSRDSRERTFGYVNKNDIIGQVVKSLIPFKDIK